MFQKLLAVYYGLRTKVFRLGLWSLASTFKNEFVTVLDSLENVLVNNKSLPTQSGSYWDM